jgi:hypothetical protein
LSCPNCDTARHQDAASADSNGHSDVHCNAADGLADIYGDPGSNVYAASYTDSYPAEHGHLHAEGYGHFGANIDANPHTHAG